MRITDCLIIFLAPSPSLVLGLLLSSLQLIEYLLTSVFRKPGY